MRDKDVKFYVGNKEVQINENIDIVGDKESVGTLGLWELIVSKEPDREIYTDGNYDNNAEIMHTRMN